MLSAEKNADPMTVMASEHQNHSRILANSVLIPRSLLHGGVLGCPAELVSHAADRLDEILAGLELLAQMADVHVDGAIERRGLAIIKVLHQGIARQHAAG